MNDDRIAPILLWVLLFAVAIAIRTLAFRQSGLVWEIPSELMLLAIGILASDAASLLHTHGFRPVSEPRVSDDLGMVSLTLRYEVTDSGWPTGSYWWSLTSILGYVLALVLSLYAREAFQAASTITRTVGLTLGAAYLCAALFMWRAVRLLTRAKASEARGKAPTATTAGGSPS